MTEVHVLVCPNSRTEGLYIGGCLKRVSKHIEALDISMAVGNGKAITLSRYYFPCVGRFPELLPEVPR